MNKKIFSGKKLGIPDYINNNNFGKFLDFFGDISFFKKIDIKDTLTIGFINNDEKNNNKYQWIKNSLFGDVDYFIN